MHVYHDELIALNNTYFRVKVLLLAQHENPPSGVLRLNQVHSAGIHVIARNTSWHDPPAGDGIFANPSDTSPPLGILTADCAPIVFMHNALYGVVHAGWKGIIQGIVERTAGIYVSIGIPLEEVLVFVGPCAHWCCYQVPCWFKTFEFKCITKKDDGCYLSVRNEVVTRLVSAGIPERNINVLEECTICSGMLPSWRRQGKKAGKICTIVEACLASHQR